MLGNFSKFFMMNSCNCSESLSKALTGSMGLTFAFWKPNERIDGIGNRSMEETTWKINFGVFNLFRYPRIFAFSFAVYVESSGIMGHYGQFMSYIDSPCILAHLQRFSFLVLPVSNLASIRASVTFHLQFKNVDLKSELRETKWNWDYTAWCNGVYLEVNKFIEGTPHIKYCLHQRQPDFTKFVYNTLQE